MLRPGVVNGKAVQIAYDIHEDAYWLINGERRLLLRGLTCSLNGLLDPRPLEALPAHEGIGVCVFTKIPGTR